MAGLRKKQHERSFWPRSDTVIEKVQAYIKQNEATYVDRLKEFLRIPSISTDPQKNADTRRAAEWVQSVFAHCGIESEIVETPRHPAVLADTGPADSNTPTILIYGHYDVQPVGDPALWQSGPFDPTVRDGAIYARGSADDKGQVLTHMLAAEAWRKTAGKLPVRFKFLIEGEEEIGSPNLDALVETHRNRLACDYVTISDTAKLDWDTPAITYGTKGLIYKEIEIRGPKQDLHSGSFGGTVPNPGDVMCRIIGSLHDADQRVNVPGFYDDVKEISEQERKALLALPFDEAKYLKTLGSPALLGEKGYTTQERKWTRPTLDVNGLFGGFIGEGASTIIPHKMGAKVSMRLVPDQNPEKISAAFEQAVLNAAPKGVTISFKTFGCCASYVCPLDLPALAAAKKAIRDAYGKEPVMMREGGSLPILPMFKRVLKADSVMMGFSVPDCNLHGPNEFFHISDFLAGIRASASYAMHLASLATR